MTMRPDLNIMEGYLRRSTTNPEKRSKSKKFASQNVLKRNNKCSTNYGHHTRWDIRFFDGKKVTELCKINRERHTVCVKDHSRKYRYANFYELF